MLKKFIARNCHFPLILLFSFSLILGQDAPSSQRNIVILRPVGAIFKKFEMGFKKSIGTEFNSITIRNCQKISDIQNAVSQHSPECIIVFGTNLINLFEFYQAQADLSSGVVPSILIAPTPVSIKIKNSVTLCYEVPLQVYKQRMEAAGNITVNKIGILASASLHKQILKYVQQGRQIGTKVVYQSLITKGAPSHSQARRLLKKLWEKSKVDMFLFLKDPTFLTPEMVNKTLKPYIVEKRIPVVVTETKTINDPLNFGNVCVRTDLIKFGRQIAGKVQALAALNWAMSPGDLSFAENYATIIKANTDLAQNFEEVVAKTTEEVVDSTAQDSTATEEVAATGEKAQQIDLSQHIEEEVKQEKEKKVASNVLPRKQKKFLFKKRSRKKASTFSPEDVGDDTKKKKETSVPSSFSGEYVEMINKAVKVLIAPEEDAALIGIARAPEHFPVLGHKDEWYKIQFFSSIGWVHESNVMAWEPFTFNKLLTTIFTSKEFYLFGSLAMMLAIGLLVFVILKKRSKHVVKIPKGKSCLIISKKRKKIPMEQGKPGTISLRKFFIAREFSVAIASDLYMVNNVLMHYIPDIICVDWRFSYNVRTRLNNILSERSFASEFVIVYYNTVDSANLRGENKFADSTYYLGSEFYPDDISKFVPIFDENGKTTTSMPTVDSGRYLQGKILNDNLPEIFQLIESGKKTGCMLIEDKHPFGMLFFEKGIVTYAATEKASGIKAVFNILAKRSGSFHFIVGKKPKNQNLNMPVVQVLMEWAKYQDERAKT